jgi:hypothetical protein
MGNRPPNTSSLKPKSISQILDYIATYYILTSDFKSLKKLHDKEYCDKLVVLTSDVVERHFTEMEVTYLAQRIKNGVEVNEEETDSFMFMNDGQMTDLDIHNSVKKKRVCAAISKFYVKIAHIYAAIVTTINPIYVYKDENGNTEKVNIMDKKKIPTNAPRDIYKLNICENRIQSLNKKSMEVDASGNVSVAPDFCGVNTKEDGSIKSLAEEPGIPELEQLYYDEYDFETGKFNKMSEETKKVYMKDLAIFNEVFSGNKDSSVQKFSDIKLRDFSKVESCRSTSLRKKYQGTKSDKLFRNYADNLKKMIYNANRNQEALLTIVNQIFVYTIDPHTNARKIRIHPTLTEARLKDIVVEARALIVKLYLTCEMDYVNGLKMYEAIVEQKILDTAQIQIAKLSKISEELILEDQIPIPGSEFEIREKAEEKIADKKKELEKQMEELKKDEELIKVNPGEVLNETNDAPGQKPQANVNPSDAPAQIQPQANVNPSDIPNLKQANTNTNLNIQIQKPTMPNIVWKKN